MEDLKAMEIREIWRRNRMVEWSYDKVMVWQKMEFSLCL